MKIKEHDCVILTHDLPAEKLQAGDVEVVVHTHQGGVAYEVEFVTVAGKPITVQNPMAPSPPRFRGGEGRGEVALIKTSERSLQSSCAVITRSAR